ncbi:MAG: hypothetical protein RSE15_06055 [Flavobacterium sp.]|uniref:hypothetical protein n=1 Tax=Flavobacterium sp. TaxID=239 RepID=UPI002B4A1CAB|nr:hypothetical protein [Flavobacterium sp.]WRH74383.1 MAG: hypothetical protein RSE15_06055 [Flavobacterium sp.]
MEPNKIDNQFREKLNAREIQPSAQAWDRLDAMLTISEEKKPKKGYGWFFVAASTLFFFGMGFFIFSSNETTEINNSIPVVTTINEEKDSVETNKINDISVENNQLVLVQNEVNYPEAKNNKLKKADELEKEVNLIQLNPSTINDYPSSEKLLVEVQVNQKEIPLIKKNSVKSKIKIDAASLLSTVEKELDVNYKETTLDKLTKKFQDAKSALANRNYE